MNHRRVLLSLLVSVLLAGALPARADDEAPPRQRVGADPAKAKAQEAERQRLVAKLRAEAPKVSEAPPPSHPVAASRRGGLTPSAFFHRRGDAHDTPRALWSRSCSSRTPPSPRCTSVPTMTTSRTPGGAC